MAPRDNSEARETVFENLGLDSESLGLNRNDDSFGLDDDFDLGNDLDDSDTSVERQQERVSHTATDDDEPAPQREQQTDEEESAQPAPQEQPQVRADQQGNLVDQSGKIVARAGAERRLYTELHQARGQLQRVQADAQQRLQRAFEIGQELHRRMTTLQQEMDAQQATARQLNLQPNESLEAMQLFAQAKTDPVGVLKTLLTRAAANGIDISSLGLQSGSFDPAALMRQVQQTIDNAVQPVVKQTQTQEQQRQAALEAQQRDQDAQREVQQYFTTNPDMLPYAQVFLQAKQDPRTRHMGLLEIGLRLKNLLLQQRQQQNPRPRSLPNGRGSSMQPAPDSMASVDDSWDDIIRSTLNAHGV